MSTPYDSVDRSRMIGPISISGRFYRVIAVPEGLPNWVPFWLDGQGAVVGLLAASVYRRHDQPPYQVRLLSFPRFALRPSVMCVESFDSMGLARLRAKEIHAQLKNGTLPQSN